MIVSHHKCFSHGQFSGRHLDFFNLIQGLAGHWVCILDETQFVGTLGVQCGNDQRKMDQSLMQSLPPIVSFLEEDADHTLNHFQEEGGEHP